MPGALALAAWGWSLYAAANAGGRVGGSVARADGASAAGAVVVIADRNITSNFVERRRVAVGADGRFLVDDNASHMIRVQAIAPDGARSEFRIVRLWFRAQNMELTEPLVLRTPAR
ncbi:MAG: hypothetical protein O9277_03015 [Magnetospirillum sp.]|nr:hypothetical protein [Magnetospirillum sp.]